MDVSDFLAYPGYLDDEANDYEDEPHELIPDQDYVTQDDELMVDAPETYHMTAEELWTECSSVILHQTILNLSFLFLTAVFFLFLRLLVPARFARRSTVIHLLIIGSGYYTIKHFHRHLVSLAFLFLSSLGWLLLLAVRPVVDGRRRGLVVGIVSAILIFVGDRVADPTTTHKGRGTQIIFFMKLISLAFDNYRLELSFGGLVEYFAYMLLPVNAMFGPWISIAEYRKWCQSHVRDLPFTLQSWNFVRSLGSAFFFLLVSDCLAEWLLPELSNRWLLAYQSAVRFRFSHYFICCLSESLMALAGFENVSVTKPLRIEMSRSLVDVVKYWNIPMRNWLREYVFNSVRRCGSVPLAIFVTYAASSLLHGFNFQLSAVLLTLAFFTYAEHELRRKLAGHLDACIEARACSGCNHRHKGNMSYVLMINLAFGLLAVLNLAYLGDMFDSGPKAEEGYDFHHTLFKWSELSFAGHYIMALCYGIQLLL